jgi:hypothetical protein
MEVKQSFAASAPAWKKGGMGISAERAAPGDQQIVQATFQISVNDSAVSLDFVGKGSGSVVKSLVAC